MRTGCCISFTAEGLFSCQLRSSVVYDNLDIHANQFNTFNSYSEPHGLVESLLSITSGGHVIQSDGVLSEVPTTHPDANTLLSAGLIKDKDRPRAQYMVRFTVIVYTVVCCLFLGKMYLLFY